MTRALITLMATFTLAACQGREVASLCAGFGDPAGQIIAVAHDPAGRQVTLTASAGDVRILDQVFEEALLPRLWLRAEPTMRGLPEDESAPCGLPATSHVTVRFADGTAWPRSTSCEGNALHTLTEALLASSAVARPESARSEEPLDVDVPNAAAACDIAMGFL